MDIEDIKIDTDIPLPERRRDGESFADVLRRMDVGHSFAMEDTHANKQNVYNSAKRLKMRVSVHKERDKEGKVIEGYVRVWRRDDPPPTYTDEELAEQKAQKERLDHIIACTDEECMVGGHEKWLNRPI